MLIFGGLTSSFLDVYYMYNLYVIDIEDVMATKLTLRIDEKLIKQAKNYAKQSGKSLSKLVADFFTLLSSDSERDSYRATPKVESLRGILRDARESPEEYKKHLEQKYL